MDKSTMTARERWEAVLRGELPDKVPTDYWATDEVTERLLEHLGCADELEMYERLHVDYLVKLEPEYVGPPFGPDEDMWGAKHRLIDYGTGTYDEIVYYPLAQYETVAEIKANYTWPSADWFDYSTIPAQVARLARYPLKAGWTEPMYMYANIRGQEQAYMDLILNPELVHYCLGKIVDFTYEQTLRVVEQAHGQVLVSYVAEDMGTQEALLYSPEQIREFIFPQLKRVADMVHQAGAYVFHHSDGAIRPIIPELIDTVGIDILNPIQWRCQGMDRAELKSSFGGRLVFHGAMDNQQTLPFGSVEQVRQEVRENLEVLGAGGGYILAPCHNIQPVSPLENIVAMYEEAYAEGFYA